MSTSERQPAPQAPGTTATPRTRGDRKVRQGVVVSDKMDKTVVVRVERRTTHPLYRKTVTQSEKLHAHDEHNDAGIGDLVRVAETRPLSAKKRWRVVEVLERAK